MTPLQMRCQNIHRYAPIVNGAFNWKGKIETGGYESYIWVLSRIAYGPCLSICPFGVQKQTLEFLNITKQEQTYAVLGPLYECSARAQPPTHSVGNNAASS